MTRGRKSKPKDPEDPVHIVIKAKTREELRDIGTMRDNFDDVIWQLIQFKKSHEENCLPQPEQAVTQGGETQDGIGETA